MDKHQELRAELKRAIEAESSAYRSLETWRRLLEKLAPGTIDHVNVSRHVAFRLDVYRTCRVSVGRLSRQVGIL